jgi:hypothetical protein
MMPCRPMPSRPSCLNSRAHAHKRATAAAPISRPTHTHTHRPTHTNTHPPTHTHTHPHTHARKRARAHTHTHTHARTHARTHPASSRVSDCKRATGAAALIGGVLHRRWCGNGGLYGRTCCTSHATRRRLHVACCTSHAARAHQQLSTRETRSSASSYVPCRMRYIACLLRGW